MADEDLLQRIERAGADVAEDDAERAEREPEGAGALPRLAGQGRRRQLCWSWNVSWTFARIAVVDDRRPGCKPTMIMLLRLRGCNIYFAVQHFLLPDEPAVRRRVVLAPGSGSVAISFRSSGRGIDVGCFAPRGDCFVGGVGRRWLQGGRKLRRWPKPRWLLAGGAAWDLSDLYPSDAAWEAERQAILKAIPAITKLQGQARRSAATLKAAMQAQSDIGRRTSRLYTYASLKADEDLRVAPNQERKQQAQDVFTALGEATAWANPEIVALGAAKVNALLAADPGLDKFAFGLATSLRLAPHTFRRTRSRCSPAAGTPLAGPQDIRDQLAASDIPRPTVKLATARKSGSTTRAIRWPAAHPTATTASRSSTISGRATRLRKLARRGACGARSRATCSRAKARKYRQRAPGRARRRQPARSASIGR